MDRANGLRFTRWAAGIALFGYLALFPLLVLAFIAFGMALSNHPEVRVEVESFLKEALPLLFDPQNSQPPVDIEQVTNATLNAGIIAVVGLLITGLGWVDSTIEGVRRMQGVMRQPRNWLLLRLQDTAVLLVMGTILLVALIGALIVEAFGTSALERVGVDERSSWVVTLTAALMLGLLVWLVVASLYGLAWWKRTERRWRPVLLGSLYATLALVVLTQFSFLVVGRTLTNPAYGALAVAAALLVFLYVASAVLLYFACWVAVCEETPRTLEEVAYLDRLSGGTIKLPTIDD
ncbi:MAG: YihY/virulence factor BrkB family protein [Actinomycetia bacterium]|nr:YihY/virulence factor BrkB family protein [Actinomycetes bacterium]